MMQIMDPVPIFKPLADATRDSSHRDAAHHDLYFAGEYVEEQRMRREIGDKLASEVDKYLCQSQRERNETAAMQNRGCRVTERHENNDERVR